MQFSDSMTSKALMFMLLCSFSGLKLKANNEIAIENQFVKISFTPETGKMDIFNKNGNMIVLKDATFRFDNYASSNPEFIFSCSVDDALPGGLKGKLLNISGTNKEGITIGLTIDLADSSPVAVFTPIIKNGSDKPLRIKNIHVIADAVVYPGQNIERLQLLDGNGGGELTHVRNDPDFKSRNNILFTGMIGNERVSITMGGLSYEYYEKFATLGVAEESGLPAKVKTEYSNERVANLYGSDPVGKLVEPGKEFASGKDKFYLDVVTVDPFVSLENYALAVKKEQNVKIPYYTFPTVCLWYASHNHYGGEAIATNDSKGAVEEMDRIVKSGFLNYSTAAVRLVPDSYLASNEQGWWDDAHWQKYGSGTGDEYVEYNVKVEGGHYKPPFETTKKWGNAVIERGGVPILYFQTGVRSQDYAEAHPDHMLFNEANHEVQNVWPNPGKSSYDFTDTGFIAHMQIVYRNLRDGNIAGLMFDYPESGWSAYGGFDDQDATTAWAYRNIFKLAFEGIKRDSTYIDERNITRGSDVTLGLIASQRVWGDTDGITPEMVTRCGLRWYKNRILVSYDTDSKNLIKFRKVSRDKLRQALTMVYVATGRMLVGNSFGLLDQDDIYDVSRTFPYHTTPQSARPVDAFINTFPAIYDFKVNDTWHLITLYNTEDGKEKSFDVPLSASNVDGGLALNPSKDYYFYDFWNQTFIGKLSGSERLEQPLRPDEARMIAIHEVESHPQFISTNRHIMQGYLELKNVNWDDAKKSLSGKASVVGGEPFKIILALNGYKVKKNNSSMGKISVNNITGELAELIIENPANADVDWNIKFKK